MSDDLNYASLAESLGRTARSEARPVVCVQGLGFVGAAMAVAVAAARRPDGSHRFNVVGVDLDNETGRAKTRAINSGKLLITSRDPALAAAFEDAIRTGNLIATTSSDAYALADVTLVDIPLDVAIEDGAPVAELDPLRDAIRTLGENMRPGALIIIETTVPPGTCGKIVAPELDAALAARKLKPGAILLAHSFERVMPGPHYLDSIVNFWRVFGADDDASARACEKFLGQVIDCEKFPLTRLGSTASSELAKIVENSYRAVNIAFIEEWGRLAEAIGVDIFPVLDAIRKRPTHANIRHPGFGVGGYCLTKDPLFGAVASRQLFDRADLDFPFSRLALETNQKMPLVSLDRIEQLLGGSLAKKRLLVLGVAYRDGIADTRYAPAEIFVREALGRGAMVTCHDPLVRDWPELNIVPEQNLPDPDGFDAVMIAVAHEEYVALDLMAWLGAARPLIFDAHNVLTSEVLENLARNGVRVAAIGRAFGP